jgi:hypothetical protein
MHVDRNSILEAGLYSERGATYRDWPVPFVLMGNIHVYYISLLRHSERQDITTNPTFAVVTDVSGGRFSEQG